MLNPSVEPAARRDSVRERRDSEGKARRNSAGRPGSRGSTTRSSAGAGRGGSVVLTESTSAAALEARNQRRSIGLKVGGLHSFVQTGTRDEYNIQSNRCSLS